MRDITPKCRKLQININNNTKWYIILNYCLIFTDIINIYLYKYIFSKKYHSGIEKTRANCK